MAPDPATYIDEVRNGAHDEHRVHDTRRDETPTIHVDLLACTDQRTVDVRMRFVPHHGGQNAQQARHPVHRRRSCPNRTILCGDLAVPNPDLVLHWHIQLYTRPKKPPAKAQPMRYVDNLVRA